jgi:uncharacterized protein (TIGR03437 family)
LHFTSVYLFRPKMRIFELSSHQFGSKAMRRHLCLAWLLAWTFAARGADFARPIFGIGTVAGSASMGDGGPATAAQIGTIQGIATDRWGNLYLSDTDHHRVRKIDAAGTITTVAGTGIPGFSGDGGPATSAQLNLPYGLAVDLAGYLYIADLNNSRVRRVSPDGTINTYAGSGGQGSSGDGGPATSAQMLEPRNVAVDAAGNLYISEFAGHRVRKVTPDGLIATAAGIGIAGFGGDGGPAVYAQLAFPAGLALDRQGNLYIADSENQRVRKLLPGGQISTALGGAANLTLLTPIAVAVDLAGDIYVVDSTAVVREYTTANAWIVAAGTSAPGYSGDGGPANAAQLTEPLDLSVDLGGNLYIADQMRVRGVNSRGIIHTVAGDDYLHSIGDGSSATMAELYLPSAVALDSVGNLYIADPGTARVRQVGPSGVIATAAGTGVASPGGEATVATATTLMNPVGVAMDQFGNLLIAEMGAHRIRQVSADGRIRTIVGTGVAGLGPELLPPAQTQLRGPRGLCLDRAGDLYVVDTDNHRVLLVPPAGLVFTAAGNGAPGSAGDGGLARLAQLNQPSGCTADSAGNLYIADTYNHRIRKVDSIGTITTVAGAGVAGYGGDEGPATSASLNAPRGVAADDNGNIYISDTGNNLIRQVTPDGVIHTIAGTAGAGFAGDGGPALAAAMDIPGGILLDGAGDLYFADTGNNRVRRLVPTGMVTVPLVTPPPPLSVVNAASLNPGAVAPGEAITIFGSGLGPQTGAGAVIDPTGLLANLLEGTEVRFDGVPAPLYYAQANQINVQVPYTVAGNTLTHIEVFYQGVSVNTADVAVAAAAPGIFSPAVNQDGSYNSQDNPAQRGTFLTFYATGEGLTNGPNLSGLPAAAPYPQPDLPVTVTVSGVTAQIAWYGSAPGLVGLLQANIRVPGGYVPAGAVPLELTVGTAVSADLTIWLQ